MGRAPGVGGSFASRAMGNQPPHIRQPPAVDGLVVVADEEDPVVRCGQQARHTELARIHVLDLIHEQVRAPRPPAREERCIFPETPECQRHEVVEIDRAGCSELPLVGEKGPGDGPGRRIAGDVAGGHGKVQLQAGERAVQPAPDRRVEVRTGAPEGRVARTQLRTDPGVAEDLEAQGVERPHPHTAGRHAQRRERRVQACSELLGGARVERDRRDRRRVHLRRTNKPGDARHECRRLAAPRGCDAQDGSRRCCRRFPLIGREARQPVRDGGGERGHTASWQGPLHRRVSGHCAACAGRSSRPCLPAAPPCRPRAPPDRYGQGVRGRTVGTNRAIDAAAAAREAAGGNRQGLPRRP